MAATRRTRRDLWLAAVFLWMTPLAAALSIRFTARRSASALSSAPLSAAPTADFERVRSSARTDLLRRRRFSFWRFRLIWLLMLATGRSSVLFEKGRRWAEASPVRETTVAGGGPLSAAAARAGRHQRSWPGDRDRRPGPVRSTDRAAPHHRSWTRCGRAHTQLLHHQSRGPRQVDPFGPDSGDHRRRRPPPHAGAVSRLHGY